MNNQKDCIKILKGEHILPITAHEDIDSSEVSYSFPLNYGDQIPIAYEAKGDFLSYKIINDKTNNNQIIRFKLPPLKKEEKKKIHLKYWVLIKNSVYEKLEKTEFLSYKNDLPDNFKKWVNASGSIQADNFLIKVTSKILKGFSDDLFWYSKKVAFWISYHGLFLDFFKRFVVKHPFWHKIFLPDSYWYPLEDALSGLIFGGICSAQANLIVAFLRARDIPARILITSTLYFGAEKWMDSQHYIAEFYTKRYGWIRIQAGRIPSIEEKNIVLRVVNPNEEDLAGNGLSKYGGMAPWFWFSNKNIDFYVMHGYMDFKLPRSKKIGFPLTRASIEKKFEISSEKTEEILKIAKENWNLFLKFNNDENFYKKIEKISFLQCKALESLKKSNYKDFFEMMNDIKKYFNTVN